MKPNKLKIHGTSTHKLLEVAEIIKSNANEEIKWEISYSPRRPYGKLYRLIVEVFQK